MTPPIHPPTPPTPPASPNGGGASTLDAYLDGMLTGPALAAFEARLKSEPDLRAQVELQRRIDAALRRTLSPPQELSIPAAAALNGHAKPWGPDRGAAPPASPSPRQRVWWAAMAAALVLLAAGSWLGWRALHPEPGAVERYYFEQAAAGLRPEWVCENDEQMATYLEEQWGQRIFVAQADAHQAGIELVGWTSRPLLSAYTSVLLTRVEGRPVLVLVDTAGAGPPEAMTRAGGLRLFDRCMRGLTLYEITPLDAPRVITLFRKPGSNGAKHRPKPTGIF